MSDGDWLSGFAPKLIGAIALVLVISTVWAGWQYGESEQIAYEQEAKNAHEDYAKYACYNADKAPAIAANVAKPNGKPCVENEKAKEENDNRRDYADLVAQRSSALWAKIMGIAALIGMGLSAIGVVLVWITFRETRRGAVAAAKSANDMRMQNRAYLKVRSALMSYRRSQPMKELDEPDIQEMTFDIEIENNGGSRAAEVVVFGQISWLGGESGEIIAAYMQTEQANEILENATERFRIASDKITIDISKLQRGEYVGRTAELNIKIQFKDVYGDAFTINESFSASPVRLVYNPEGRRMGLDDYSFGVQNNMRRSGGPEPAQAQQQ